MPGSDFEERPKIAKVTNHPDFQATSKIQGPFVLELNSLEHASETLRAFKNAGARFLERLAALSTPVRRVGLPKELNILVPSVIVNLIIVLKGIIMKSKQNYCIDVTHCSGGPSYDTFLLSGRAAKLGNFG